MQKILAGVVVGVVVIGGSIFVMNVGSPEQARLVAEQEAGEEKTVMEKNEATMQEETVSDENSTTVPVDTIEEKLVMTNDAMMGNEDQAIDTDDAMMKKVGVYAPYEASKLAMVNSGDVVLFFKASWCPSCRALDADIKANLDIIPSDLTILELDYDSATALKQQYGVTTQHTLVQVDANGTLIKKWSGGSTMASIVAQIQ